LNDSNYRHKIENILFATETLDDLRRQDDDKTDDKRLASIFVEVEKSVKVGNYSIAGLDKIPVELLEFGVDNVIIA